MKIVEIVIVEGIANQVGVLEVFDELVVAHLIAMSALDTLEHARIDAERRRRLDTQLGHVSSIAVHVVVADHHAHAILAHVASMTLVGLRVTTVAVLVATGQVPIAGTVQIEAIVNVTCYRLRILELCNNHNKHTNIELSVSRHELEISCYCCCSLK